MFQRLEIGSKTVNIPNDNVWKALGSINRLAVDIVSQLTWGYYGSPPKMGIAKQQLHKSLFFVIVVYLCEVHVVYCE